MAEGNGNGRGADSPVVVEVAPALAETVLARVVGILASRAGLGVDRVTEALALAEAISSHGQDVAVDGRLRIEAEAGPEGLALCLGPVPKGAAKQLLESETDPELGSILDRLADDISIDDEGGERMRIRFAAAGG